MTDHLIAEPGRVSPVEVRDFVGRLRRHLADLDAEEQQELTAGLEADLADLVAERGSEVLGDPARYARELRVAAGHSPEMDPRLGGRWVRQAVMAAIDTTHASWDRLLDSLPGDLRGFLAAVQPVWWVMRAGVAWMVAQDLRGPWVVVDGPWLLVLAVFTVVSVQLGRRSWGLDRLLAASVLARLLLVGLNVFAVTMAAGAADRLAWHVAEQRAWQFGAEGGGPVTGLESNAVVYEGREACELEIRDVRGRAVPNAYVWDLTGDRPLPMSTEAC